MSDHLVQFYQKQIMCWVQKVILVSGSRCGTGRPGAQQEAALKL